METDFIVSYAQIISAVATFIVAFVLLYELKQQHKDAAASLCCCLSSYSSTNATINVATAEII